MSDHRKDAPCHCAVCHDGYSRLPSLSPSASHGVSFSRTASVRTGGGFGPQSSRMTLTSECLSATASGGGKRSPSGGGVSGGEGSPGAAGRGSPGAAGRGSPGAAGRGSPGAAGRGSPGAPNGSAGTPSMAGLVPDAIAGQGAPGQPGGTARPGGAAGAGGGVSGAQGPRGPDRAKPMGSGVGRRSALADKYMYAELDHEDLMEPAICEEPEPCTDLERDDSDLHKVEGRTEAFFPQPEDDVSPATAPPMEPVGPWAQGKPDWGPLAGLTGTRPVVDRHSITRFSVPEWRKANLNTFQRAAGDSHNAGMVEFNGRACMQHVAAEADKNQQDSTARLQQRAQDVHRWLEEVRKAHGVLWAEVQLLEAFRPRLRRLLCVLNKCASVAGQSLELRTHREEPDLVRDEPEEELVKEVALIGEVRGLVERCLQQVEEQQSASKAAKARLSATWSDKTVAYELDSQCAGMRTGSTTAMFREGATRFPDSQSTPSTWEAASREDICLSENERAKSSMLRNLIEAMIDDAARDLRQQEARVDDALQRRVQVVTALLQELEGQLALILRRIVETERLIEALRSSLRQLDMALKVAQDRLHSRLDRSRIENCRDCPQYGLVDEVKSISEQCSALVGQLKQAEDALQNLLDTRQELQKAILQKRKCLYVDRDRVQNIRQHFPSAAAMTGRH